MADGTHSDARTEHTETSLADRYLGALGIDVGEPTLELLGRIVRQHVAAFPFSSVGVRLGDPLPLDPELLFDRIVRRGRGGYCFEHNGLLFAVLAELGYDVTVRLARVIHNGDHLPGLTHRISHVHIDHLAYVVDVGFGPSGPAAPVAMPREDGADLAPWPPSRATASSSIGRASSISSIGTVANRSRSTASTSARTDRPTASSATSTRTATPRRCSSTISWHRGSWARRSARSAIDCTAS